MMPFQERLRDSVLKPFLSLTVSVVRYFFFMDWNDTDIFHRDTSQFTE